MDEVFIIELIINKEVEVLVKISFDVNDVIILIKYVDLRIFY